MAFLPDQVEAHELSVSFASSSEAGLKLQARLRGLSALDLTQAQSDFAQVLRSVPGLSVSRMR